MERGLNASAGRESGQTDLFGMLGGPQHKEQVTRGVFPAVEGWDKRERLARERGSLGFYISGHPLDGFHQELTRFCNATTASIGNLDENAKVSMGGVVEEFRERNTKTGSRMAFFQLEDTYGRVEVIVRERALEAHREALKTDRPVLITGVVRPDRDPRNDPEAGAAVKLLLDGVEPLVDSFRSRTKSVRVRVRINGVNREKLAALREALEAHPGKCPVTLLLESDDDWRISLGAHKLTVDPSEAMLSSLERLFGEKVCELR